MTARTKRISLRVFSTALFAIGAVYLWAQSAFVLDESYMATQRALGGPGFAEQMQLQFVTAILVTLSALVVFVVSFKRPAS